MTAPNNDITQASKLLQPQDPIKASTQSSDVGKHIRDNTNSNDEPSAMENEDENTENIDASESMVKLQSQTFNDEISSQSFETKINHMARLEEENDVEMLNTLLENQSIVSNSKVNNTPTKANDISMDHDSIAAASVNTVTPSRCSKERFSKAHPRFDKNEESPVKKMCLNEEKTDLPPKNIVKKKK